MNLKYIILVTLIVPFAFKSKSQTCCSGGTPLTGNLGIQAIEPKSFYFQLAYDYNFLDELYSGTELLNDNSRERITQTIILQAIYAFSEKISVNGIFTYVDQERTIFSPIGENNVTGARGLGDAIIMLQYSALSNFKRSLVFALGPKLPIGKFDATDDEFGLVLSPDLQPGSGSFDAIGGVGFQESHLLNVTGLNLLATAGYRLTTAAKRFEGDNKYRFGNEAILSMGIQKNFQIKKVGLSPSIFIKYRNVLPDKIEDLEVAGTGGNWVYFSPGINLELSNAISFTSALELPVFRNLNGTQLTTTYRFNTGLTFKIFRN